ncbi:MAG: hypothetical protein HYZ51_02725 [Candidatus Doudnabacteria bacterium]|nr:hypothetical protein [Candidatus Doudnabacteria bacterium]
MAQINLLKQNKIGSVDDLWIISFLNKVALVAFLAVLSYYGWLAYKQKSAEKEIQELQTAIESQKQGLSEIERRDEVLVRQAQIKEYDSLISRHVYWSRLLPELAKVTLKQASYLFFQAENEGTINLALKIPSIAELDKFLQVFNSPKLNRYFSNLTIGGINKVQEDKQTYVRVDVKIKYDTSLLNYQP